MVKTKGGSGSRKAVGGSSSRKGVSRCSGSSGASGLAAHAGGFSGSNSVCVRPTPTWQKGIGSFFQEHSGDVQERSDKENRQPADSDDTITPDAAKPGSDVAEVCSTSSSQEPEEAAPEEAASASQSSSGSGESSSGLHDDTSQDCSSRNQPPASPPTRNGIIDSDSDDN